MATADPSDDSFQLITSLRWDPSLLAASSEPLSTFYMPSLHRDRLIFAAKHFSWPVLPEFLEDPHGLGFFLRSLRHGVVKWVEERGQGEHVLAEENAVDRKAGSVNTKDVWTKPSAFLGWTERQHSGPLKESHKKHLPLATTNNSQIRVLLFQSGIFYLSISPTAPVTIPNLYPFFLPLTPTFSLDTSQKWTLKLDTKPTPSSSHTQYKTTNRSVYDAARSRAGLTPYPIPSTTIMPEVLLFDADGNVTEGSITTVYFYRGGGWVTPTGGQHGTTRRWALQHALCIPRTVRTESLEDGETVWLSNGVSGFGLGLLRLHSGEGEDEVVEPACSQDGGDGCSTSYLELPSSML